MPQHMACLNCASAFSSWRIATGAISASQTPLMVLKRLSERYLPQNRWNRIELLGTRSPTSKSPQTKTWRCAGNGPVCSQQFLKDVTTCTTLIEARECPSLVGDDDIGASSSNSQRTALR